MKIDKVFTFGCSLSDYMWKVTKPYGQYVSEELNAEYIHEGAGCGSNERIFRKFFQYIREGSINTSTLVTLQFTELTRGELWFYNVVESNVAGYDGGMDRIEKYDSGGIFKYKWDSYKWNTEKALSKIMKDKTDYCLNEKFQKENSLNMIYSIIEICKLKKIPFIIINSNYNTPYKDFKNDNELNVISVRDIQRNYPTFFKHTEEFDYSHLSQEGHIKLANRILSKIKEL